MAQTGQITFYTHAFVASPFCQRVYIALEEVKADYTPFIIDMEKPCWYNSKINPVTGKIPAKHPPEEPSREATVLVESGVILEFLAETFPSANPLPADAILRAKARIFVSVVDDKIVSALHGFFSGAAPASDLLAGFEALQALLPPAGFAVGEWSIADVAAGPFLSWILLLLENDLGRHAAEEGKKALEALGGPKFARITKYVEDVKARESFRAIRDETATLAYLKTIPAIQRN